MINKQPYSLILGRILLLFGVISGVIFLFVLFAAVIGSGDCETQNMTMPNNVTLISTNEAITNGAYVESEVYDLSAEESIAAVELLKDNFPKTVEPDGFGYKISDDDNGDDIIELYDFSDYHIQLVGVSKNNRKLISAICLKEYNPTYPNEHVLIKGTPPDIIAFVIDLEKSIVAL